MKVIPLCIILFLIWSCKSNPVGMREADEPLIVKHSKDLKPLMLDPINEFKVKNERKVIIDLEGKSMDIRAQLTVNGDTLVPIRFTTAVLKQDTLEITIFELNEASDNFYKIKVVGGKYIAQYDFSMPIDQKNRRINTLRTKLVLNSSDFKRGEWIRGYTQLEGKCTSECEIELITVEGNFTALIE